MRASDPFRQIGCEKTSAGARSSRASLSLSSPPPFWTVAAVGNGGKEGGGEEWVGGCESTSECFSPPPRIKEAEEERVGRDCGGDLKLILQL